MNDGNKPPPGKDKGPSGRVEERRARAARALRANLRRRKTQARERGSLPGRPRKSPGTD